MARILCWTNGLSGLLFSSLELSQRLMAAGHEVTYVSIPEVESIVRDHGVSFVSLAENRLESLLSADARRSLPARWMRLSQRRRRALQALGLGQVEELVRHHRPDLLLLDCEMHEHIIAASATGVPMALLNSFVSIWRRPGLPPPHRLVQPGVGWWGTRLGQSSAWWLLRVRKWSRAWAHKIRRAGCDRLSLLRLLAREKRFPFDQEADFGQWLIPCTYRRLPVLTLHALEFEFPHTPRVGVHYVGPMVPARRIDRQTDSHSRARLERVYARRRQNGASSVVYAGFGSYSSVDSTFLQQLLRCFARRADWDLVLALGRPGRRAELGSIPDNVHVFTWAPQLEILQHADVAVVHGGINTADECVLAGVPMLVYCGHQTDMAGTTARVLFHGIGLAGRQRHAHADEIEQKLDRLLTEPGFARRLERLREHYLGYRERRVAEATVASLLCTASPQDVLARAGEPA